MCGQAIAIEKFCGCWLKWPRCYISLTAEADQHLTAPWLYRKQSSTNITHEPWSEAQLWYTTAGCSITRLIQFALQLTTSVHKVVSPMITLISETNLSNTTQLNHEIQPYTTSALLNVVWRVCDRLYGRKG